MFQINEPCILDGTINYFTQSIEKLTIYNARFVCLDNFLFFLIAFARYELKKISNC